jgi:hypothetical protein
MAKVLLAREEKEPGPAEERVASVYKIPDPLLARGHGEDPEVRDAEVPSVKALPPGLAVAEELAPEGGLLKALPHNGHRTAIGFEEKVGAALVLWRTGEAEPEDAIRLSTEAVELLALSHFDLPTERQAQSPGRFRRSGEYLLGRDELHPLSVAAGHLEGHHDLGDGEGVAEELAGDISALPSDGGTALALGGEDRGAPVPEGIDQGFGALGIPVELRGGPVEVAMVEKELQAPKRRLSAPIYKRNKMRGAQEPVPVDGAQDQKVARRELDARDLGALEARKALVVSHRLTLLAGLRLRKAPAPVA